MSTLGDPVPFLTPSGWTSAAVIEQAAGPSFRVLFYDQGVVRFEHRCDRGDRGVVICAPALDFDGGHVLVDSDPVTIAPSILCPDCDTHGFVRSGRWVPA